MSYLERQASYMGSNYGKLELDKGEMSELQSVATGVRRKASNKSTHENSVSRGVARYRV